MEKFWKNTWSIVKGYNAICDWLEREKLRQVEVEEEKMEVIETEELKYVLRKSHGLARITEFWLNCLTELHGNFTAYQTDVIQN